MSHYYNVFISGYLLFRDFCDNVSEEPVPHLKFYEEVSFCYLLPFIFSFNIDRILLMSKNSEDCYFS